MVLVILITGSCPERKPYLNLSHMLPNLRITYAAQRYPPLLLHMQILQHILVSTVLRPTMREHQGQSWDDKFEGTKLALIPERNWEGTQRGQQS